MAAPLHTPLASLDPARFDLWQHLAPLDAAFAWTCRATLQASALALLILAARALLRHRLSPHTRYALWLLLALPLLAPLLPRVPLPQIAFPHIAPNVPARAPAQTTPSRIAPTVAPSTGWRVEYGPVPMPTPAPSVVRPAPINWLRLTAIGWVGGVGLFALRVMVTHARAVRRARRAPPITDPDVLALLHQCCRTVGTHRAPRLVTSPGASPPALLGLLRPHLLLPEGAAQRLSRAELRFVFLHELVHLRRGDLLSEWLLTALQLLHWFNPLLWLAAARCRADREIACDAAVVALAGESARADYGRALLTLATDPCPCLAGALGILETRSPLEQRLRMLTQPPKARGSRLTAACGIASLSVLALALVACTNASRAADPAEGPTPAARTPGAPTTAPAASARPRPADAKPQAAQPDRAKVPTPWREISGSRERTVAEEKRDDPKNAAVRAQLERVLPELNFDATPFTEVVDFLRDVTGANIFINWNALKAAGVERNAPVTARLREIRFAKALSVVLDSLPPGRVRLGYGVDDGVITVSTAEDFAGDTITRVYDVRDLLITIPDHEPPPALDLRVEPSAKPQPDDPAARERAKIEAEHGDMRTRQETIDELIRLITETVAPESWRDAGGTLGSVRELQGQFIITQTADNHVAIVALLEQLRQARGVQIGLEAKFISVNDEVLAALPADLRAKVEGELRAAKDPAPADPNADPQLPPDAPAKPWVKEASKPALLTPQQVDQLLRATQASKRSTVITAPRITLFNGQSAYVLIANQRAYTADYVTIKDNDGSTRYEPQIGTASSGVVWSARATASADRKSATVSMRPRLTILESIDEVPWDRSPPDLKLTVQRPRILASELATTATIPDNQTLLLGGLKAHFTEDGKFRAEGAGKGAAQDAAVPVILLVQPKLIIQREIETKTFPLNPADEKPAK